MKPHAHNVAKWTAERIPDQSGRLAIVTGANSGLGAVTARELARAGGRVVLACRNLQRGEGARRAIETAVPGAQLELEQLDLASLDSVRAFAERFRGAHERLDLLCWPRPGEVGRQDAGQGAADGRQWS
jgi:NAD(P)-dependent dehydrogenase (short-subunit alcohol dehydrogenase family)